MKSMERADETYASNPEEDLPAYLDLRVHEERGEVCRDPVLDVQRLDPKGSCREEGDLSELLQRG